MSEQTKFKGEGKVIPLMPPEDYEPLEDKALRHLALHKLPDFQQLVELLGLQGAVTRYVSSH